MNPSPGFREFVAAAVIALFAWAFYKNPDDEIIIGSLLTAFATAIGFYLGGSKVGSDTAAKNADTVAAQAKAANGPPLPEGAKEAADQTADAARDEANRIGDRP